MKRELTNVCHLIPNVNGKVQFEAVAEELELFYMLNAPAWDHCVMSTKTVVYSGARGCAVDWWCLLSPLPLPPEEKGSVLWAGLWGKTPTPSAWCLCFCPILDGVCQWTQTGANDIWRCGACFPHHAFSVLATVLLIANCSVLNTALIL